MKNSLYFLLLLISSYAHAIKGTYSSKDSELPQTCKLTFQVVKEGKTYHAICTATYIGQGSFTTAEHCHGPVEEQLARLENKEIDEAPWYECPGIKRKIPVKISYPIERAGYIEKQDIAVMKVDDELKELAPMDLPKSAEEIENLLKDPTKCYISGYGVDNDDKSGTLRSAQVVEWDKNAGIYGGSTYGFKLTKNYAQFGDSGGPLFCYDGKRPVLVGVTSDGRASLGYSISEKLSQALGWIKYVKASSNPESDQFKNFVKVEEKCTAVEECFAKLQSAAKLSADMKKIFEKLSSDLKNVKTDMAEGKLEKKKFEEVWDGIDAEWRNNNCYEVLYPSKK